MGWDLLLPPWTRLWDLPALPSRCWAHLFKLLQGVDYRPASTRLVEWTQQENGDHPACGGGSGQWGTIPRAGGLSQKSRGTESRSLPAPIRPKRTASDCITAPLTQGPLLANVDLTHLISDSSSQEERNGKFHANPPLLWPGAGKSLLRQKGGEEKRRIAPKGTELR